MRLRPGIFTRIKANNEVEAHANVMPGKGVSHRYFFEPETSVFRINVGQSKVPLLPILKAMGTPDNKIREAWGNDIFAINQKHDSPHVVDKLYRKLVRKADPDLPIESKAQALTAEMLKMEMDPEVTKRTLGKPYASLTADAILDTTRKLLAVNKREADPDDRDHLAFQNLMGPEDLIAERIGKDRTTLMKLLWHSTNKGNLSNIQPGSFTNSIMATFRTSGLGQAAEEVNAAELVDHQGRITRLGEGGIGDAQRVPMESRSVHPSQMAFVDPIKTPESFKAGVDLRTAYGVQKGSDGRFYAPFNDPKVPGRKIYKSPQELADLTVAFPGELSSNKPYVQAMIKGKLGFVSRDKIDIELPSRENVVTGSPSTQRTSTACSVSSTKRVQSGN
jgi:DNA-directed RNA polymerase beta subunit